MAYTSLSGKKLQKKLGGILNEAVSAPASSFAQKQMEKMGWKKGEGLGLNKTGIKSHVKVRKREDDVGIGHDKLQLAEASNMWWSSSVSSTLAKLANKTKQKSKKKSKKKIKMHYTDDELFEATGGARFGMRAQRRAEAKWARSEKSLDLTEQEKNAAKLMEWNGLGEAKCVISQNINKVDVIKEDSNKEKKKRKRDRLEKEEEKKCDDDNAPDKPFKSEKEIKRMKKKQKKEGRKKKKVVKKKN